MEPGPAVVTVSGQVLARNTALNLLGRLLPMLVALAALPYLARHLDPARFGLLSMVWLMLGYFMQFDLGMGPAVTKYAAEALGKGETNRLPQLVWTAVGTQSCLGLAAGAVLALAAPLLAGHLLRVSPDLRPEAQVVFRIFALVLPVEFIGGTMRGVLAASQRFDLLNAVNGPANSLIFLLPAVAVALGLRLPAIVLFLVMTRVVTLGTLFILCRHLYPALRAKFRFDRHLVRLLLGFGGWVTVSGIVGPLLEYFDRFVIAAVISVAAVGFYTPPYMVVNRLLIFPASLVATLFPAFSTSAGRGDTIWIQKAFLRSLKLLILVMGPCVLGLASLARPLLHFWLGAQFAKEGALPLQILGVGVFLNSLAFVPSQLLYAMGRPDLNAKFHLAELPTHLLLLWFLIPRFGLPGAALACTIKLSLDCLLLTTAACWMTRTPLGVLANDSLKGSFSVVVGLGLVLLGVRVWTNSFLLRILLTIVSAIIFVIFTWNHALEPVERRQIRDWLKAASSGRTVIRRWQSTADSQKIIAR